MRFFAYLGLAAIGLLPVAAQAADVSESGAKELENQVNRLLPVLQQILKVSPTGDHYDASIDLKPILHNFRYPLYLSDVTPVSATIRPRADGHWDAEAKGTDASIAGEYMSGIYFPGQFKLHVRKYDTKTTVDPAVGYPLTAGISLRDLDASGGNYTNQFAVLLKSYVATWNIGKVANGKVDLSQDAVIGKSRQTAKLNNLPYEIVFTSQSSDNSTSLQGGNMAGLDRFVRKYKGDGSRVFRSEFPTWQQFAGILRDYPILIDSLETHGSVEKPELEFAGTEISADRLVYHAGVDGIPKDNMITVGLTAYHPTLKPGQFHRAIELAMPDEIGIGFVMDGFKLEDAIFAGADLDATATPRMQDDTFRRELMRHHGKIRIRDTFARSQYYDVSMTGWMVSNPIDETDTQVDVTIKARELDKTVAFLQANANSVPEFGRLSLMLLMAKGCGKTEADGSISWHIQGDRKQDKLIVNGRVIGD